jgi:copper(I)-binding protein
VSGPATTATEDRSGAAEPAAPTGTTGRGRLGLVALAAIVVVALVVVVVLATRGGGGTPRIAATRAAVGATTAGTAAAYLDLTNSGSGDDRLIRVTSPVAPAATLHVVEDRDGLSVMTSADDGIDLPAGSTVALDPGRSHVMLGGLQAPLVAGARVPLHLEFEHARALDVQAEVVPLEQLAERVGR